MFAEGSEYLSFYTILVSRVPLSMVLISEHFLDLFSSPNPDLEQLFSAKNFPNSPKTIDPSGGKILLTLLTLQRALLIPQEIFPIKQGPKAPCPTLGELGAELATSLVMI